jgi:Protein of unknown function (DUF1236)
LRSSKKSRVCVRIIPGGPSSAGCELLPLIGGTGLFLHTLTDKPERALLKRDGGVSMKLSVVSVATAVGIFAASQALAETVVISPEQHTMMREYVYKEKIKPRKKIKQEVVVGSTLPEEVELVPVPEAWGPALRTYHYVYTGDRFYFVEPSSRRVVHIE